jgi:hypothetical protein
MKVLDDSVSVPFVICREPLLAMFSYSLFSVYVQGERESQLSDITYLRKITLVDMNMVVNPCNPSTRETEADGMHVQGQLGLYSEILF